MKILDVTKRFQTTVPKTVREILSLSREDKIVWVSEGGEVKVKKA